MTGLRKVTAALAPSVALPATSPKACRTQDGRVEKSSACVPSCARVVMSELLASLLTGSSMRPLAVS